MTRQENLIYRKQCPYQSDLPSGIRYCKEFPGTDQCIERADCRDADRFPGSKKRGFTG